MPYNKSDYLYVYFRALSQQSWRWMLISSTLVKKLWQTFPVAHFSLVTNLLLWSEGKYYLSNKRYNYWLSSFPHNGTFWRIFWKHCGKRRNCLFNVFYRVKDRNYHFCSFNLSSANAFNLVLSKILSCGNGLTLSQMPNFTNPNWKSLQTTILITLWE